MDNGVSRDESVQRDLEFVFNVLSLKQIKEIAMQLDQVKKQKHGVVYLIVKNGELNFVDIRLSKDVRKEC